jgi:hypothetical protein
MKVFILVVRIRVNIFFKKNIINTNMIFEAAEDDTRRSQMGEDFLHSLMSFLYSHEHPLQKIRIHGSSDPKGSPIIFPSMFSQYGIFGDVMVAFRELGTTSYMGRASNIHSSSNIHDPDGKRIRYLIEIVVDEIPAENTNRALYYHLTKSRTKDTFLHEIQHILDYKRRKTPKKTDGKISDGTSKYKDNTAYFNSPAELNAYFHNVAEPVLARLRWLNKHPYDTFGLFDELPREYKEFLEQRKRQLTGIHRTFWNNLSEANRRKVMSRLSKLYDLLNTTIALHDKYAEQSEDSNV